ncbi:MULTISPECIES: hypothetical protein [unclassified Clostridium]|nr:MULTISPECIES: hypothetical protein [unclassified Clostridium]
MHKLLEMNEEERKAYIRNKATNNVRKKLRKQFSERMDLDGAM